MEEGGTQTSGKSAILIAGPTASGKSALALELAKRRNGIVINADSMQLYEDLRIVSARPSAEEEAEVPHRLYGILPAATAFSTGAWLRLAVKEIEATWERDRVPIVVGGTGLYFKALTEGFADMPDIPDEIRKEARELAQREGIAGLKRALASAGDADGAASLADPQRLSRALEVIVATGEPLSQWQEKQQAKPFLPTGGFKGLVLAPPRPWLHERIALRAGMMLTEEGIEEVRCLLAKGLPASLPAMRAIGVAEIRALLSGECDTGKTAERLTVATRQYAKRQETWFRNQMADWQRVDPSCKIEPDGIFSVA